MARRKSNVKRKKTRRYKKVELMFQNKRTGNFVVRRVASNTVKRVVNSYRKKGYKLVEMS